MSQKELQRLVEIGRRVDPTILRALRNGSARDFRETLDYHFESGGKRMRAAMVLLSCGAAGGKPERGVIPAAVIEMIHNYSLVMDDLIDHGELRRGMPTVRAAFGDSVALLVAMFYREALDDLIEMCPSRMKVRRVAVEAMKEIIDGERLDLLFEQAGRTDQYLVRNRVTKPSFDLYLNMIGSKTAALFRAAGQMGALAAGSNERIASALGSFGWKAGLAFQIMDDVLDIGGRKTGKQRGKDLVEHKLGNAVILVALRFLPNKKRLELRKILETERVPNSSVVRALALIEETPADADCREIAMGYLEDAKKHLAGLKESSYKLELTNLADEIVTRSY